MVRKGIALVALAVVGNACCARDVPPNDGIKVSRRVVPPAMSAT